MKPNLEALAKGMDGLGSHFGKAAAHHMALHKCYGAMSKAAGEHATMCKAKADALEDGHVDKAFHLANHEFHKAASAHHEELANLHKAHADHCTACQTAMGTSDGKAAGAEGGKVQYISMGKNAEGVEIFKAVEEPKKMKFVSTGKNAEGVELFKQVEDTDAPAAAAGASDGLSAMVDQAVSAVTKKALGELNNNPEIEKMVQKMVVDRVAAMLGDKPVPTNVHGVLPDMTKTGPMLVPRPGGKEIEIDASKVPPEFADAIGI